MSIGRRILSCALGYGLLCCAAATAADRSDDPPPLAVALERGADSARIEATEAGAVVTIESKRGIGSARIMRTGPQWPKRITLRLAVAPLEGFFATCGERQLEGRLGFNQQQTREKVLLRGNDVNGEETVIAEAALPITRAESYIEIELPSELFGAQERVLHVRWVDAYR